VSERERARGAALRQTDAPPEREHGLACCARCCGSAASRRSCVELYSAEKIRGFLHLYIGEEAVAWE
jgi:pyruvate dehydrogenase E1 component alpha subunit